MQSRKKLTAETERFNPLSLIRDVLNHSLLKFIFIMLGSHLIESGDYLHL